MVNQLVEIICVLFPNVQVIVACFVIFVFCFRAKIHFPITTHGSNLKFFTALFFSENLTFLVYHQGSILKDYSKWVWIQWLCCGDCHSQKGG